MRHERRHLITLPVFAGESGVVQTAWALLGLMAAQVSAPNEVDAVERGIRFLMVMQKDSGDWDQENITGVFNRRLVCRSVCVVRLRICVYVCVKYMYAFVCMYIHTCIYVQYMHIYTRIKIYVQIHA